MSLHRLSDSQDLPATSEDTKDIALDMPNDDGMGKIVSSFHPGLRGVELHLLSDRRMG